MPNSPPQDPRRDLYVVKTADLAGVVNKWVKDFNREQCIPDITRNDDFDRYTGLMYLTEKTGYSWRSIRRITAIETVHTSESIADRFISAMQLPHYMGTVIKLYPNPRISSELFELRLAQELA